MKTNVGLLLLFTILLCICGAASFAQQHSAERIPAVKDQLRDHYSDKDFRNFLQRERTGEIPFQGGVLTPLPGTDVLINNNTGSTGTSNFTQSEASILSFGNNIVIAYNDAGSFTGGANKFTGWSFSSNGGATFNDGGTLPTNGIGDAGDPVLARNETSGKIYLTTLGFTGIGTVQVFSSTDNGLTWLPPVNGTPGGSSEDKEWITVDNYPGQGNGNVYLISRRFGAPEGIYLFRSIDNGITFGPTGGIFLTNFLPNQGAYIIVGPDHSVYAFWYAGTILQMRKSTDGGLTFGPPVTVASGLIGGVNGDLSLTGLRQGTATFTGFRSNEFPHVAVNPVSGNLYVVYDNDGAGADKADIFMVISTDGGFTWGVPQKINDDVTITDQWQPTIAVTPNGQNLGIFYYSRQDDPANNNLFRYYGRVGSISGSTITFNTSFPISDVPSLPEFGRDAVVNTVYMGDYNNAVATNEKFFVTWSDNRDDLAGGAPRKDPNVYYDYVPLTITPQSQYLVWEGVAGGQDYSGVYIKNWLISKGYTVDYTTVFPNSLNGYNGVFLSFGNFGPSGTTNTVFDSAKAALVQSYLEGGGKVYLEGGDALEFDQATNVPLHSDFGLGDGSDGGTNPIDGLTGQSGSLAAGLLFSSSTQVNNTWIDLYVPTAGTSAFVESSYGIVGVQYAGTFGQKTFCFSYAIAALTDGSLPNTKDELLTKILFFFNNPVLVPDIVVSPPNLSFTVPSGNTDSGLLNISNTGGASLNWNSYENNVTMKLRMPDGQELPAENVPKFEWKKPIKGKDLLPDPWAKPSNPGTDVYTAGGGENVSVDVLAGIDCSGGLIYDDGTAENGYGYFTDETDDRIVSRFDFPSYPYNVGKICIAFTRLGTDPDLSFNIVVYDDDGTSGGPGTLLASIPFTAPAVPIWPAVSFYDFSVAGLIPAVSSGRVWIGTKWNPSADQYFYIASDQSPASIRHPGWRYTNADGIWKPIENTFPAYKAMFIRAERSTDDVAWIDEVPSFGTIGPGTNVNASININTAGLLPGNYACNLIISSNDPDAQEVAVPVTLNVTSGTVTANYAFTTGWNMLSLPVNVPDNNYLVLFPGAVPNTLFYFNSGYHQSTTVNTAAGYWLKFPSPQGAAVNGSSVTGCTINLSTGWNMIGGPNCTVPLVNFNDPGGVIIPGTLYTFSGSYVLASSVIPTKGYWIKASAPGTININCPGTLAKDSKNLTLPEGVLDPFSRIEFYDAASKHQILYFNGKLNGQVNSESFSLPPAAPDNLFDIRLSGDYYLTESSKAIINLQGVTYPLTVNITNLKSGEGNVYKLKEIAGGETLQEYIITAGQDIILNNPLVTSLMLVKDSGVPSSFDLTQNYPNPFNPSTVIKFNLAESREVNLTIYNSLGEKIKTLVSGLRDAGYYTVNWDGTNEYGASVGSGTYIYSLRAGDYHSVKKMMLIK